MLFVLQIRVVTTSFNKILQSNYFTHYVAVFIKKPKSLTTYQQALEPKIFIPSKIMWLQLQLYICMEDLEKKW